MTSSKIIYPDVTEAALPSICASLHSLWGQRTAVVHLHGILGAGKTTWVRAYLAQLGYGGRVKSPTYSLVEMYTIASSDMRVAHFDLYRLQSDEELYYLGIEDIIAEHQVVFIEWPEKGGIYTPQADVEMHFTWLNQDSRRITVSSEALPLPPQG
jgi:tRNA threonylcarbamoyladenosine biosynthesis protein TsaE